MPPGSASPGHRAAAGTADLGSDLKRLRDHFRIDNLISLIEDHELRELGISGLVEVCGRYGIAIDRFPIKDVSIPKDAEAFAKVISKIVQELARGYRIAIHCKGDLGRAGTVTACAAAAFLGGEIDGASAMAIVRDTRKGAIETVEQERFVVDFSNRFQKGAAA